MLRGLAILLLFQLAGESVVFLSGLRVPGPVVGLTLLLAALPVLRRLHVASITEVEKAADTLLANLGLFFVPAGVGVVALGGVVGAHAGAIMAVLVTSAILTLAATVWSFVAVRRLIARKAKL